MDHRAHSLANQDAGQRVWSVVHYSCIGLVIAGIVGPKVTAVHAYSPDDPVVVEMVERAANYLEGVNSEELRQAQWGGGDYHPVICGYAHYKSMHDPSSKLVKAGLAQAKKLANEIQKSKDKTLNSGAQGSNKSIYEASVSIMLLAAVDPEGYRSELAVLRDALLGAQMRGGGFGYFGQAQGDISQVQYVVLAMWTLEHVGIEVDNDIVASTFAYLMRVQDIGGAWPYLATDPGPGKPLIKQGGRYMSHSTALAGASSILIAGDHYGLWGSTQSNEPTIEGLPEAVKLYVEEKEEKKEKRKSPVDRAKVLAAVERMNVYRKNKPYDRTLPDIWHYYSLYSLERFESFYEFARGSAPSGPDWYDEGVKQLKKEQEASGRWSNLNNTASPPPVATAFAILFLIRGTQRSILAAQSGVMGGGYELPKDTTKIRVDGTQIKGQAVNAAVTDLLDILEDDSADDLEGKSLPDDLELDPDPKARAAQLDRLERLVRGSSSWQARRVAARLLGKSDEMRVVPALIFALSDPDTSVKRFARDGLRFISRKFDGFDMPDKATDAQARRAQQQWKDWYLTMRPGYVFLEDGF